jgi:hypothetical protein
VPVSRKLGVRLMLSNELNRTVPARTSYSGISSAILGAVHVDRDLARHRKVLYPDIIPVDHGPDRTARVRRTRTMGHLSTSLAEQGNRPTRAN